MKSKESGRRSLWAAALAAAAAVAVLGVAVASPAANKVLTKSDVKRIADQEIGRLGPIGRGSSGHGCSPSSSTFDTCEQVTLTLNRKARVLLVGEVGWHASAGGRGTCRLTADGAQVGDVGLPGNLNANTDSLHQSGQGLTVITAPLAAGSHTFRLQCNQGAASVAMPGGWLAAVRLLGG